MSDVNSLRMLLHTANMMKTHNEEVKFFKIVERYFDPDSSYIELVMKRVELNKHFNRMQTLELGGISQHAESLELDISQHSPALPTLENQLQNVPLAAVEGKQGGNQALINLTGKQFMFHNIEEEDSYRSKNQKQDGKMSPYQNTEGLKATIGNLNMDIRHDIEANSQDNRMMSQRLNSLLGHELLYFEFVENILLYLLVTVSSGNSRTN